MTDASGSGSPPLAVCELIGAEVLVVDGDRKVQAGMTQLLSSAQLRVTCSGDPNAALALLDKSFFSVAVVDLDTPSPGAGLATVDAIKRISPTTMVVVLTPRKSFTDAVAGIRAGAVDVVWKAPESVEYLVDRVLDAAGRSLGRREVNSMLAEVRDAHQDFLKRFMDAERRALDAEGGVDDDVSGELCVLVVAPDTALKDAFAGARPTGMHFEHASSGGEALDRCSSSQVHLAIVCETLPDLPGRMVVRSIKTQSQDTLVLLCGHPGEGGSVVLVESERTVAIVDRFERVEQLAERFDELAAAFRARARERRYTQAFRERHSDFLRRYIELKLKIERTLDP